MSWPLAANLSLLFPELPLIERVVAARQAGFEGVEIQFPYDTPVEQLASALAAAELPLVLINLPAGDFTQGGPGLAAVPARQDEFDAALAQAAAYAAEVRPQRVNVLPGRLADGVERASALACLVANLRRAADAFAELGIGVCCEAINRLDIEGFLVSGSAELAELIAEEVRNSDDPQQAHIFFSAHGVPKSYVEEAGDPYQQEIEACTALIMSRLAELMGHANPHTLAYQSRVGPVEWLKPYTEEALEELGEAKVNDLVVVPISFVSEHIETLEEIDIEYRELATEAGVVNFRRVRALDTYPPFIEGLADLVTTSLEGPEVSLDAAAELPTKVKLYPQEKWEWGWNNSSEVWNGRLAMLGFSAFLLELISGQGPLHALGLL